MRKIKVIQIGLGHDHATEIFDSILYQRDIFEVAAFVVPPTEEKTFAERVGKYRDECGIPMMSAEDALNIPGLDAAIIETEEENLTRYALMAANKGLHIHMDKPGGLEPKLFEELIDVLKKNDLSFSLGYMYRFNPFVSEAIEKAKSGRLGEIYSVEAHMDCEHPFEKRQWLEKFPGGMMFFLGCHLIDLIYQIQGEPEEVIPLNTSTGYNIKNAQDFGMALFKYPNGVSFAKTCDAEAGGFLRRQLVICGTKGTIEIRPLEKYVTMQNERRNLVTDMREVYADGNWHNDGSKKQTAQYNRYDAMMKNFVELVNGKTNPFTYDYELNLYKLILKSCGMSI